MVRRLSFRTTEAHRGLRLDDVLAAWLPEALSRPLSRAKLRRLIMAGAVRVDGRPLRRAGRPLDPGTRIEAVVRLDLLGREGPARDKPFALTGRGVLYEDEVLIAVDKPPGLPMHPTADPGRPHLVGSVRRFLAARPAASGPGLQGSYLGIHQRLDRDTSGVVLFTKDPAANAGIAALFARHELAKTYHGLTRRPLRLPPRCWRIVGRLGAAAEGRRARVASVRSGGALAETELTRLEAFPHGLLVEARPRTGRKHQVRVHLAEAGLPILGDDLYGGAPPDAPPVSRLMLHAVRLAFRHPLSGAEVLVESPYPEDFRRALEALRRW